MWAFSDLNSMELINISLVSQDKSFITLPERVDESINGLRRLANDNAIVNLCENSWGSKSIPWRVLSFPSNSKNGLTNRTN